MLKYIKSLFNKKQLLSYSVSYLNSVKSDTYKISMYKEVRLLHYNIFSYLDMFNILIKHDYNKHILYQDYNIVRMTRDTYIINLFTTKDGIVVDRDSLINELITKTIFLININDLLLINNDDRINHFNSKVLQLYIINVCDMVSIITNTNKELDM